MDRNRSLAPVAAAILTLSLIACRSDAQQVIEEDAFKATAPNRADAPGRGPIDTLSGT